MSCSLHDAVTLEERGVPVVVLCTTPFMNASVSHAGLLGRPDLRAVEVRHPLVTLKPDEVRRRAEFVLDGVVATLLGSAANL